MAKKKGYTGHSSEHSLNARGVKTRQFEVDVIKATGTVSPENLCHHCKKNPVGPGKILCSSCNKKIYNDFANQPYTQRKHDVMVDWMVDNEGVENYRDKLIDNVESYKNIVKDRPDREDLLRFSPPERELEWFNQRYPKKKYEGVENYRKELRNNVNFLKNHADKPVIDQAEFELKWFNERYPKKK